MHQMSVSTLSERTRSRLSRPAVWFTVIGALLWIAAGIAAPFLLVGAQVDLPYRTVAEAFEAGDGERYLPAAAAAGVGMPALVLMVIGFVLGVIAVARGDRRPSAWTALFGGVVGLILGVLGFFAATMLATGMATG